MKKKQATLECKCGCGEKFTAWYTTRRPKYKDQEHATGSYMKNGKKRSYHHEVE